MKVLMVCLGNICRSPIAEGVLKKICKEQQLDWQIDSAGTGARGHEGAPPHKHSITVCVQNSVDISAQRARQFTPADLVHYDRLYAMSEDIYDELLAECGSHTHLRKKVSLLMDELHPGANRSIADPYYGSWSSYPPVYQMISQACNALVETYQKQQATAEKP